MKFSEKELWEQFVWENEKIGLKYVEIDADQSVIYGAITDEQIEKYYQEHKEDFRVPDKIKIVYIEFSPKNFEEKISLTEEPGGCWNVEPRFDEAGVVFELTQREEWKFIRIVSSGRAYFHDKPDEKARGKSYVIEGDVLRGLEVEGDWVRGEYYGSQGITTGWIKESDSYEIK